MATELEKLLQSALDKALSESANGLNDVISSFNGLKTTVTALQNQVSSLNAQQQAAQKREEALIGLCNGLATQLEHLSTRLSKIGR